jgi:hypothetical protein
MRRKEEFLQSLILWISLGVHVTASSTFIHLHFAAERKRPEALIVLSGCDLRFQAAIFSMGRDERRKGRATLTPVSWQLESDLGDISREVFITIAVGEHQNIVERFEIATMRNRIISATLI